MAKGKVKVISETDSGRNTKFKDTQSGNEMTRHQFVQKIKQGKYPKYHVRNVNGQDTPASNPDGKKANNLG